MRVSPLVRIVRPALAPTAAADVLAGAAFVGGAAPLPLAAAVAASLCLYTGGMAQNDLCDRARDATLQPDRPLVENPALVPRARLLVIALFLAGLVLAALADVLWPAVAIVVLASSYNVGVKRYFPFDGITLGAARAANLWLGVEAAGGTGGGTRALFYAGAYLVYIAGVTAASRAEDMEPPPTRRLALLLSFVPQAVCFGVLAFLAATTSRALLMLAPPALLLAALIQAMRAGTRPAAKRFVFRALLCIYAVHGVTLFAIERTTGLIGVFACAGGTMFLLALTAPRG